MLAVLFILNLIFQNQNDGLNIQIPSLHEEATSVWRTINDYSFLEKQGYTINLPTDPIISKLIEKSKSGQFGSDDFQIIYSIMESKYYNLDDYKTAYQKTMTKKPMIETMIKTIRSKKDNFDWDFKLFETYRVVFTLYGTGGSYNPDNGTITLFTTQNGRFMRYDTPENTIIHEIVHMGIEASLVQTNRLNHGNKEWLTDFIVLTLFRNYLPDYVMQNMGDQSFISHMKSNHDLNNLAALLKSYQQ